MALDVYDDIAEETADNPATAYPGDLKNLPDGEYKFSIHGAVSKTVKVNQEDRDIVEFTLEIISDGNNFGKKYRHTFWLIKSDGTKDEIAISRLNADLKKLGFDVENWKRAGGRPWSKELPKALKCCEGVGFIGRKVTKNNYPNLYINERSGEDGKPAKFDAAYLDAANRSPFDVPEE